MLSFCFAKPIKAKFHVKLLKDTETKVFIQAVPDFIL